MWEKAAPCCSLACHNFYNRKHVFSQTESITKLLCSYFRSASMMKQGFFGGESEKLEANANLQYVPCAYRSCIGACCHEKRLLLLVAVRKQSSSPLCMMREKDRESH